MNGARVWGRDWTGEAGPALILLFVKATDSLGRADSLAEFGCQLFLQGWDGWMSGTFLDWGGGAAGANDDKTPPFLSLLPTVSKGKCKSRRLAFGEKETP